MAYTRNGGIERTARIERYIDARARSIISTQYTNETAVYNKIHIHII